MKFCGKCGTQIEDNVKFCPGCGASTEAPQAQQAQPTPQPAPQPQQAGQKDFSQKLQNFNNTADTTAEFDASA